jgi:hypothetical protein
VIKPVARLAVVCAALAAAFWLLPATVAVASWPSTGPVRVAFLPPLQTLWIALAISALLVAVLAYAWRKAGRTLDDLARTTAPLSLLLLWTVPFLPKLADLAPTLLVLAGPVRWVVAVAAVGGVAAAVLRSEGFDFRVTGINRRAVFAVAFIVYAAMGIRFARQIGFGGDEPHYLVITHSLFADRDLDIANNHEQGDYASFFPSTLQPDFLKRGKHGEIYSIHAPGLPAMLVPAYALGGATGAVIFVALLAAFASLAVVDLASRLVAPAAALVTWAAVSFSVPFVPHAWLIYPEIVAALIVARAVFRLWEPPESSGGAAVNGFMLAILPWLHTKFIILTAALAMFEALRLWPKIKRIVALAVPIAASVLLWLFSFYWMYGVFDPQIPYGASTQMVVAANIPRGVLGLLFDQKFGLLVYSPLYVLAVPGIVSLLHRREHRLPAVGAITTAVLFLAGTTRFYMWWGGSSPPARFLVPIVPLLAPFVAYAIAGLTNRVGRALVVSTVLLTIGIAFIAAASTGERLLYSDPHGFASLVGALQGPAPLDLILPTFTEENLRTPIVTSLPWLAALVIAAGVMMILTRLHAIKSAFWMAITAPCLITLIAGLLAARPASAVRAATATRGQIALLHAYDPSRLRAVNASHGTRLTDDAVRQAARVELRSTAGTTSPWQAIELPQGSYEARVWFDGDSTRSGDLDIVTPAGAVIARLGGPQVNPTTLPFEMPVTAAIGVRLSDPASQSAIQRVDITAASLVGGSSRTVDGTVAVEPLGEDRVRSGYLAYTDDAAYPEHGVFWTRGTDRSTVVVVKDPGAQLRLVLHVGPSGGKVDLGVDQKRLSLELKPNETRDVPIDLAPGTARTVLSIRADRAFVPASIEAGSTDLRSLGCQVRPVLF